jgi:hypothetical protein
MNLIAKIFGLLRNVVDLRHEEARVYEYPDGRKVTVEAPASMTKTRSGEHQIVDVAGVGIVVAPGWLRIEVYPNFGRTPFCGPAEPAAA